MTSIRTSRDERNPASQAATIAALGMLAAALWSSSAIAQVYRWVDEEGVTHLSSEKPPAGVKAERIDIPGTKKRSTTTSGRTSSQAGASASASPAQVAERNEVLSSLKNRECVIALEALDRMTSGAQPTSAAEIRRVQQTVSLNCSPDPARRQEQEEMAAKLRVANSPTCVQARNLLGDMLAPGATFPREQVRSQQKFVDEHCTPPVR